MRIYSPLEANDWRIKDLLTLVLSFQVALWLAVVAEGFGFELPVIRQLLGVFSMLFVPGVLLLRILRLHRLGSVEALLFMVGLSLAFDMFLGLLLDVAAVTTNIISRPLSLLPLALTASITIAVLSLIAYARDRNFNAPPFIRLDDRTLHLSLALCLLPFLSIFGAYAMNSYGTNVISIIFYVAVGITLLYVAFSPTFPKALYPLVVFVIAISMLFSTALISSYVWGWDIQSEYYYATSVVQNGVWDWTVPSDYNAMLSVAILPPLFAILGKLELVTVFKVVYPLLFALMPVGLYVLFKRFVNDERTAFLSTFFVIFSFTFILELPTLARQEIAELFLVLVLLLLTSAGMHATRGAKASLLAIFSISLIVSHYAVSLIYVALLLATWLGLRVITYHRSRHNHRSPSSARPRGDNKSLITDTNHPGALRLVFLVAFIVVAVAWYSYMSAGLIWEQFIQKQTFFLGQFAISAPILKFTGTSAAVGVTTTVQGYITVLQRGVIGLSTAVGGSPMLHRYVIGQQQELTGLSTALGIKPTLLRFAATALRLLFIVFMTIGLIAAVTTRRRTRFNDTYLCLSVAAFGMLIATALIPNVASTFNFTRFYHVSLLVLAPFCVLGGLIIVTAMQKRLPSVKKPSVKASFSVIVVLLFISCLLESNVLYETIDHDSGNLALTRLDWGYFNQQELKGAQWWYAEKDGQAKIYADAYRALLLTSLDGTRKVWGTFLGENHVRTFGLDPGVVDPQWFIEVFVNATPENAYVFLGTNNVQTGTLAVHEQSTFGEYQYIDQTAVLSNRNKVYDNGGAQVYFR